jgi:hypothetical protein
MVAVSSGRAGNFCRRCLRKHFQETTATTLVLGWWSPSAAIATPIILISNVKEYRRAVAGLSGEAAASAVPGRVSSESSAQDVRQAVRSLPWASAIGIGDGGGVGQRQLTLPLGIATIAGLTLFISGIIFLISLNDHADTPEKAAYITMMRNNSGMVLAGATVVLVGCLVWHWQRQAYLRATTDWLEGVFPTSTIFESGRIHLVAFGFQHAAGYRIVVAAQNLMNGATRIDARVQLVDPAGTARPLIPLQQELPASAGTLAWLDLLFEPPAVRSAMNWTLSLGATGQDGRRTRGVARRAFTSRARETLGTLAFVAGGHLKVTLGSSGPVVGCAFADQTGEASSLLHERVRFGRPPGNLADDAWRIVPVKLGLLPASFGPIARMIREDVLS